MTFSYHDVHALRQRVSDLPRKGWGEFKLFDFPSCRPALVLLTSTGVSRDGYHGRISVNERQVTLSAVTVADEGSYTVRDANGDIQKKVCLNVRGESSKMKTDHVFFLLQCLTCFK